MGQDRETIAVEKAGIIHAGKIAVIADPEPPQSLLSIAKEKAEKFLYSIRTIAVTENLDGWWWTSTQKKLSDLPFSGLHGYSAVQQPGRCPDVDNCPAGPIAGIRWHNSHGTPEIKLQGRFQVIDGRPLVILDVSHNPDSIALLAENLQQQDVAGKTHAVVAMLKDKDIIESLKNIISSIDYWYFAGLAVSRGESPRC